MKNCIVDEVRSVIPIVTVPFITSARSRQLWRKYLDCEFTKCFAELGLTGNRSLVSLECQCCVEARNILRQ